MGRAFRSSITARIIFGAVMAVVVVIGGASYSLNASLARLFQREGNKELQEMAASVVERLADVDWNPDVPEDAEGNPVGPAPTPVLDRDILEGTEKLFVRVQDPAEKILLESEGMSRLMPQSRVPPLGNWTWQDVDGPTGGHFLVYATRFDHGWVLTAWDIRYENRLLQKSQELLLLTWGLSTLATALVVAVLARHGLAPLKLLARHAEAIHPGALRLDLDPATLPLELEPLGRRLQEALARLEEAFARLGTLNADVAHELRTPLHGIRLDLEGLLRGGALAPDQEETLGGAMETLDHLANTLDQMLFLARSEDPTMAMRIEPLAVSGLLRAARAPFESLAEEKGVRFDVRTPETLALLGDETLVRRALHNLLANALRHAPADSTVVLEGRREPDAVLLEVQDLGEGIPPEFLSRIGQRFVRPDFSRSRASGGAGLGLAIVHNILKLHGGSLEIESAPGQGTLARLRFPT